MLNEKIYSALGDYCCWNQPQKIGKILEDRQGDIDITYDNGVFLRLAISFGSVAMLNALLQYFEEKRLPSLDINHRQLEQFKLKNILQNAAEEFDVSDEMQTLVKPYLPTVSSHDNDDGYDTNDDPDFADDPFSSGESYVDDVDLVGDL